MILRIIKKIYLRVLECLQLIKNFECKTEVELYEKHDTDDKKEIKIWLSDLDGNIFILTPFTTLKTDISKIEKLTNDNNLIYDLSLAKKFKLTSDNVELTQTGNKYDFKYGRLITDNKSFYNLFLGNNICYQLSIRVCRTICINRKIVI